MHHTIFLNHPETQFTIYKGITVKMHFQRKLFANNIRGNIKLLTMMTWHVNAYFIFNHACIEHGIPLRVDKIPQDVF